MRNTRIIPVKYRQGRAVFKPDFLEDDPTTAIPPMVDHCARRRRRSDFQSSNRARCCSNSRRQGQSLHPARIHAARQRCCNGCSGKMAGLGPNWPCRNHHLASMRPRRSPYASESLRQRDTGSPCHENKRPRRPAFLAGDYFHRRHGGLPWVVPQLSARARISTDFPPPSQARFEEIRSPRPGTGSAPTRRRRRSIRIRHR